MSHSPAESTRVDSASGARSPDHVRRSAANSVDWTQRKHEHGLEESPRMPRYCPAGDGAFDDWVDNCPECGRELQDEPALEGAPDRSDNIVWLITAPNEPEAQLWANAIRATNVPVFVRSGGPGVGAWASVSSFEHDLLVRERDLIAARRIVRELFDSTQPATSGLRGRRSAPVTNPARKP